MNTDPGFSILFTSPKHYARSGGTTLCGLPIRSLSPTLEGIKQPECKTCARIRSLMERWRIGAPA